MDLDQETAKELVKSVIDGFEVVLHCIWTDT